MEKDLLIKAIEVSGKNIELLDTSDLKQKITKNLMSEINKKRKNHLDDNNEKKTTPEKSGTIAQRSRAETT